MPEILSLALFERGGQTLLTRRKSDRAPFAGQWMLPSTLVGSEQSAEEALESHTYRELGVEVAGEEFAETLYLADATTGERFVANVFRIVRYDGELRFRAAGDYEDARWLVKVDISSVDVPPGLREWLAGTRRTSAAPELTRIAAGATAMAPDNRSSWNTISKAYQERYRLPADRLVYGGRCPDETELQLIGDVSGLNAIVLGCGGGQDCIVLAKQGATVVGIDLSDRQIEYGRRLAEREGSLVTLLQGNVEHLKQIDDETQDLAMSLHAMNYVERPERAFAEAFRVLKPGSPFVLSLHHPFDVCLEDAPPYNVVKSYWQREQDWQWDFGEAKVAAKLRSWYRPVGEWLTLLLDAGFRIERVVEPPPVDEGTEPWRWLGSTPQKGELVPGTLIVKVVKP